MKMTTKDEEDDCARWLKDGARGRVRTRRNRQSMTARMRQGRSPHSRASAAVTWLTDHQDNEEDEEEEEEGIAEV
jgi:hypothetical protein